MPEENKLNAFVHKNLVSRPDLIKQLPELNALLRRHHNFVEGMEFVDVSTSPSEQKDFYSTKDHLNLLEEDQKKYQEVYNQILTTFMASQNRA